MTTPAEIDLSALPPEVRAAVVAERVRRLALEAWTCRGLVPLL